MSGKSDLVGTTISMTVFEHTQTRKAILVSEDGDEDNAAWIPLSQCEIVRLSEEVVEITMPEWLAIDKGLV